MPITEADKLTCIEHVVYEAYQMFMAIRFCAPLVDRLLSLTEEEHAKKDLYLENHLLHLRALRDFFEQPIPTIPREPMSGKRADMVSGDYGFTLPTKIAFKPEIKDRLDKEIAHLSYHRMKANYIHTKEWDSKETLWVIAPTILGFIEFIMHQHPDIINGGKQIKDGREIDFTTTAFYMARVRNMAREVQAAIDSERTNTAAATNLNVTSATIFEGTTTTDLPPKPGTVLPANP